MDCIVYGLCDDSGLRYIGQTIQDPDKRLKEHIYLARCKKNRLYYGHLYKWMRKAMRIGEIRMIILETCAIYNESEKRWIEYARRKGYRLVNGTEGGGGLFGYYHSDETKKKIGSIHIGMKHSDESKRKMSIAHQGKKQSDESNRKRSISQKGKERPEAQVRRGSRHCLAKLKEIDIYDIREKRDDGMTLQQIADIYGIDVSNVWLITKGKTWKHVA